MAALAAYREELPSEVPVGIRVLYGPIWFDDEARCNDLYVES